MKDLERLLKGYFEEEAAARSAPPLKMPARGSGRRKIQGDYLLLAACVLGCFVLILQPSIYENRLRQTYIPTSKYEALKKSIPRVIFDGFEYIKEH